MAANLPVCIMLQQCPRSLSTHGGVARVCPMCVEWWHPTNAQPWMGSWTEGVGWARRRMTIVTICYTVGRELVAPNGQLATLHALHGINRCAAMASARGRALGRVGDVT